MANSSPAAAANRFGIGARPGDLEGIGDDPRGWLLAQLNPRANPGLSAAFEGLPDGLELLRRRYEALRRVQQALAARPAEAQGGAGQRPGAQNTEAAQALRRRAQARAAGEGDGAKPERDPEARMQLRRDALNDFAARYRHALATDAGMVERLVRFWSNHFAVSIDKNSVRLHAAAMEREAIRPRVLGNFADLLLAANTHPAMLMYLDNDVSVGEGSQLAQLAQRRAARRAQQARMDDDGSSPPPPRRTGLNENLAREILELHTLGVDGGYRQDDVRELARAITGWGVPGPRQIAEADTAFVFRDIAHESGVRNVLGKRYAESGFAQGRAILRDLALHPSTAKHLAFKLARHFVADAPPPALVQRMAQAYLRSGGELLPLYRAMIEDDAAWSAQAIKFKTPDEFVVSAMRAGRVPVGADARPLLRLLDGLGQPVFTPRSPAGFPDTAADWASGDALRKRVQAADFLAERVGAAQAPLPLAQATLGATLDDGLASALRRAGSAQEAFALLFSSPAFQWRV